MTAREAALEYARRGWAVLPVHAVAIVDGAPRCTCGRADCARPGKHPRTPHGVRDATRDADVIRRWWTRWPDAGVAIATGAASGLVVLDVDGDVGRASLAALVAAHGPLPEAPTVRTGGGGTHIYLAHPGGRVRCRVGVARGIDVRGDGGYVVAPPSVHISGRRYEWLTSPAADLAPAPRWVVDAARAAPPPHGGGGATTTPYGRAALADAVAQIRAAPVGARNDTLFVAAAAIHELVAGGEISADVACTALREAALGIGLGGEEVERTLNSAARTGCAQPRRAPSAAPTAAAAIGWDPSAARGAALTDRVRGAAVPRAQWLSLPPSMPRLGEMLRRELLPGRVVVLGGAPGVGKTTLVAYLLDHWQSSGAVVVLVSLDMPVETAVVRYGELWGLDGGSIEAGDPAALRALDDLLAARPRLHVTDWGDIDAVSATLRREVPDASLVVAVDYAQLLLEDDDQLARAMARVMRLLRRVATEHRALVVGVSQLVRGAYAGRERTAALASGWGGSAIEQRADALVVLRAGQDGSDRVVAEVAKVRHGRGGEVALCYHGARGTWAEAAATPAADDGIDAELLRRLVSAGRPLTTREVRRLARGWRARDVDAALRRLVEAGLVRRERGARGAVTYEAVVPEPPDDETLARWTAEEQAALAAEAAGVDEDDADAWARRALAPDEEVEATEASPPATVSRVSDRVPDTGHGGASECVPCPAPYRGGTGHGTRSRAPDTDTPPEEVAMAMAPLLHLWRWRVRMGLPPAAAPPREEVY